MNQIGKSFITALFAAADLISQNNPRKLEQAYWDAISPIRQNCKKEASEVCKVIIEQTFDFFKVDDDLKQIASWGIPDDLFAPFVMVNRTGAELGDYIALFCEEHDIYWDDVNTNRTVYELDSYKNNTDFGKALFQHYCFLSQQSVYVADSSTAASTANIGPASGTAAASAPVAKATQPAGTAKANYFNGRDSASARGLLSMPHDKEMLNRRYARMYDIEFDQAHTNIPFLYINALEKKGDAGNNLNKVLEGSANGWADATLYFTSPQDADKFMGTYIAKYGLGTNPTNGRNPNYTNLHVAKAKIDRNGYFMVNTDCGIGYIKAVKLNEALDDDSTSEDLCEAAANGPVAKTRAFLTPEIAKEIEEKAKYKKTFNIMDLNIFESKQNNESMDCNEAMACDANNCNEAVQQEAVQKDNTLADRAALYKKIAESDIYKATYKDFDVFEEALCKYIN